MTKSTSSKLFLFSIFIVSFLIRFVFWQKTPLLWDEAALGYNAYSISQTLRDEYGQFMPLIFKSFGDYKPGLYVYWLFPFVTIFGLNEISVRLPSIILGALSPILLFLLIIEISPKSKKIAYIAALVCAFNPYNIHFSRGAWETNILTFELILASYFFYKYTNHQQSKYLLFSAIIFGLSLFTYQAGKMISLFLIIILFILNFKSLQFKKLLFSFIIPLGIMTLPVAYGLFFNSNANRLQVVSLFSYPRSPAETETIINETNRFDYQLFHSQPSFFIRNFLSRYFNHFSPRFLAFEGDWQNPRHSAPYIGVILYPSLIFLIIGLVFGLVAPNRSHKFIFLLWLLVAPIPSALPRDSVQSVRAMSLSIPLVYFISLGIFAFLKKYPSKLILTFTIFVYLISFIYYSDLYLNHMVQKSPYDFLYGYKQAISYVINSQSKYNQIIFSDFYGQPYIFYLFYSHYSPTNYQQKAHLTEAFLDTGKVESIDNITFSTPSFEFIKSNPGTMGIFSQEEIYRQGIDQKSEFSQFIPLSPIGQISTFYAYENP